PHSPALTPRYPCCPGRAYIAAVRLPERGVHGGRVYRLEFAPVACGWSAAVGHRHRTLRGRGAVKLAPLRPRSRGERDHGAKEALARGHRATRCMGHRASVDYLPLDHTGHGWGAGWDGGVVHVDASRISNLA